ncbi:hypothetical protein [Aquabacter spiritensis]|uniref:Uncharacterized protein n=1 Tax=Aquabacter spiritensis TaxID=933073 RepID=A0A4R3LQG4_9HYPH|nr:hypothetical protein [Aquabacter spiritensis]TCT02682.1 hypothetical protein EDC64_112118 [Aquabacter spiritensis]
MSDVEGLVYAARPKLIGPGVRFHLQHDAIDWSIGARSGRLALADVVSVRLSFHPGQLAAPNYEMRLRGRRGEDLKIGSLSRTSLTGVEDNRAAYAGFVRAVHAALAARGGAVRCEAGLPPWRWWLMGALALVTGLGLLAVLASAVRAGQWSVAGLIAVLCPLLGWPLVETLWRNKPAPYSLASLPLRLLPG